VCSFAICSLIGVTCCYVVAVNVAVALCCRRSYLKTRFLVSVRLFMRRNGIAMIHQTCTNECCKTFAECPRHFFGQRQYTWR